jgi:beta-xylosidase
MSDHSRIKKIIASASVIALCASILPADGYVGAAAKPKLNKKNLNLKVKETATLKVTGKKIKKVTWKSDKSKIAAVKKKKATTAVVTAKKQGTATIKATVKYAGKKTTLKCKVKVTNMDNQNKTAEPTQTVTQAPTNAPTQTPTNAPTQTQVPNQNTPTKVPGNATEAPTDNGPTQIPELDMNNLAVAEYPTIFSDVPDPDIIRVGGYYYMVSTTMHLIPGAPIMRSTDLVHWRIVNYVHDVLADDAANNLEDGKQIYSNGSWAAAIRYNEEDHKFYVCFNQNGYGFYVYTTDDIENGEWKKHFIKANFHDPGMLFDDGNLYVFYGGGPSNCQQIELDDENEEVRKVGKERQIIQKSGDWGLWEGCHAYKIGDYYYVTIIASPNSGWFRSETCYRTKNLFADDWDGKWEEQIIFQGSTYEYGTGVAQGGIVDTIYGDWYGIMFQDHDAIGRIPSILAVNWDYTDENGKNYKDWPMMGYYDEDGNFVSCQSTSQKIPTSQKIRLNKSEEESYIVDDDDFDYPDYQEGDRLKLVWQWNHNPDSFNWSVTDNPGFYRITNGTTSNSVWFARNSLTQRTVGPKFSSETAIITDGMKPGDYAGMVAVGSAYGMVGVKCDSDGKRYVFQGSGAGGGKKATSSDKITENAKADEVPDGAKVYLRVDYSFNTGSTRADKANFFYSMDGEKWTKIGKELNMSFDTATTFMGARTWLTNYATSETGGYVDFDYYKQSQD